MFRDKGVVPPIPDFAKPNARSWQGDGGKKCQIIANCFKLTMNPHGIIYHYNYSITPPPRDESEEQWAIQKVWGKLTQLLGVFVVRCPCHIFSPCGHGDITLTAQGDDFSETRIVQVEMYQKYRAEQVNSGLMGEAEVVAQHIIKKLSGVMLHCKVGRRYFNNFDANGGKAQLTIYSGFWTAMHTLNDNGPQI
mmetsp:Transcript_42009/g.87627  ORF Transcript_42009/g.87627 Transcript_42009/m.87627 type:complete len:193 (+) Transcript_42009:67-645(+)